MKKGMLFTMIVILGTVAFSRNDNVQTPLDDLTQSFSYENNGTVILKDGIGKVTIPQGYKYLEPVQSGKVMTEIWGNPGSADMTLGMLLPENYSFADGQGIIFNIRYEDIGYVKDNDADAIDCNKLLEQMQKESVVENEKRRNAGLESVMVMGWAIRPVYDKSRNILQWAKEVKIGGQQEVSMLNYQVMLLGRKGVLMLNATAPMSEVNDVRAAVDKIVPAIRFTDSYQYQKYNPGMDKISSGSIASLISGKIKIRAADFFSLLFQNWSILLIAVIAFFRPVWDRIQALLHPDRNLSLD